MADLAVYLGLFASALAAATILLMQSEALLVGLVVAEAQPVWRWSRSRASATCSGRS